MPPVVPAAGGGAGQGNVRGPSTVDKSELGNLEHIQQNVLYGRELTMM